VKFVGLSGGIGSGKSTVRASLAARGVVTMDVDAVSRELQEPGRPFFEQIVARWGPDVVGSDGGLDRAALAEIVFRDREQLAELTGMAAPVTEVEIVRLASEYVDDPGAIVVVESALFIGPMYGMSGLVVVDVPVEVAVERLVATRDLSETEARARVASQLPRELRLEHAGYIVVNAGTREDLDDLIEPLLEWIQSQPNAVPIVERRGTTTNSN
jgi:dephospho-CoA kinase